jgi:hypothetical protein
VNANELERVLVRVIVFGIAAWLLIAGGLGVVGGVLLILSTLTGALTAVVMGSVQIAAGMLILKAIRQFDYYYRTWFGAGPVQS